MVLIMLGPHGPPFHNNNDLFFNEILFTYCECSAHRGHDMTGVAGPEYDPVQ